MPLMDHLGELRRRCVIVAVCLLVTALTLYFIAPQIIQFLIMPISEYVDQIYVTGAFEGFTLKFSVSMFGAAVICSPIIFWEILAFFLPALKPNERRWVLPTFAVAVVLFVLGMVFCYCFCLGAAFGWLTGEANSYGTLLPQATDYVKYCMLFLVAFGLAFELPLIVFYLILFDIVPYKKLRGAWRYVYVALLVFSAAITPDASPVTMLLMFAALLVLYEVSLLAARIALARKIKRQREREAAEE